MPQKTQLKRLKLKAEVPNICKPGIVRVCVFVVAQAILRPTCSSYRENASTPLSFKAVRMNDIETVHEATQNSVPLK